MANEAPPPYRESLDPFQDISEQLDKLGVMYVLAIGMHGDKQLNVWSNASEFVSEDCVESQKMHNFAVSSIDDAFAIQLKTKKITNEGP